MLKFTIGIGLSLLFAVAGGVSAQEESVFSGPQPGEILPPLKVVMAYGQHRGKEVDVVQASGGKPTLVVVVRGANRPAARLTRALLNYAEMRTPDGLFAALVWLDDDRTAAQQYLQQAISWWGVGLPVGVSVDGAEGPGSYGLNRNVNVTVLVAKDNRVTANFALVQPSETDAPKILAEVIELIGGAVPTPAVVSFLSVPTRKPAEAKWNTAPQDVRFRQLICNLLSAPDETSAKAAAMAVQRHVAHQVELKEQLARVAETLSKGRTHVGAIPAMRYLRRWRATSDSGR